MAFYCLDYKTVVLTGASGGFGAELTKLLIGHFGCNVIGIGRTKEKMEALAEQLGAKRSYFRYYLFDVSVKDNWRKFALTLRNKGVCPDLLINNAGVMPPFENFTLHGSDGVLEVMNTNFMSAVYACEALLPMLKSSIQGGIVNVASSAAYSPIAGTTAYSASKGALKNFTLALSQELENELYVGVACPGLSNTTLFRGTKLSETDEKIFKAVGSDKRQVAEEIIGGISICKKIIVCGKDAHLMTAFTAIAPAAASYVYGKVITESGLDLFKGVKEPSEEEAQDTPEETAQEDEKEADGETV